MRKQKTKNLLKFLGSMLLVVVLVLSLVACSTPNDDTNADDVVEEVITPVRNGSFEYFTGSSAILTPSNWSFKTEYGKESGDDTVYNYRGVIDVSSDAFSSAEYHVTANPGKVGDDNYVLMINNVEKYSAAYTSSAVSIEKGKYYKLTINVKTAELSSDSDGAYIYVINGSSTTKNYVAKFTDVTAGEWTTYTSYVKASKTASSSLYVKLALGIGDEDSTTLSKGIAFFDELDCVAISEADYETATTRDKLLADNKIAKYDLALPNAEFDNTSSTSTSNTTTGTPYNWYTKRGADDNGENEAPTTGRSRGIIDITAYKATQTTGAMSGKFVKDIVKGDLLPAESVGNKVLMLYFYNPSSPTAHAYYSDAISFQAEKQYALSFYMLTYGIKDVNGQDAPDKGVTVKLGDTTLFENENTDGAWVKYTVYIDGSMTQNKSQALYFWLGTGHEDDKSNYVSGAAFFDCISLVEISQADYDDADVENAEFPATKLDYTSDNLLDATIGNAFDDASKWVGTLSEDVAVPAAGKESVVNVVDLDTFNEADWGAKDVEDDSTTRVGHNKALAIYNKTATSYTVDFTEAFTISPNTSYRLSLWVKTYNIESGKGITVKLLKDDENKSALTSVTSVNTETLADEEAEIEYSNEWTEVVFYLSGNQTDANKAYLSIVFGDGTRYNPDNLLEGTVFVRNMYLEKITYSEYDSTSTSTNIVKYTYVTNASSSVTNGNFNLIDSDKTHDLVSGELDRNPGAPASWTGAFDKALSASDKNDELVSSGIVNEKVFNNMLVDNTTIGGVNVFPYADGVLGDKDILFNGEPNLLMIWNKSATAYGYTSASKTLSASTFYKIQANVKTHLDGNAIISIAHGNTVKAFDSINTNGEWATYTFYVEVGLNSSSAKITLSAGKADAKATGVVFFDNVWYATINEDEFTDATATSSIMKYSLTTDSFETQISEDEVTKPANFTGAIVSGAPSASKYYTAGVINKNHFSESVQDDFGLTTAPVAHTGDELLAIYLKDVDNGTAYAYTSAKYTFAAKGYYKVSVWAKVQSLGEDDKANVRLSLSDTDTATFAVTETEWTEFTFLVKMDKDALSSVVLKLSLGEYNKDDDDTVITADYAKGYAFFDDVTIEKITEDDYTAGTAGDYLKKIDVVANNEAKEDNDEDETPVTEGLDAGAIITIVSASLLSVAVILVVIVVIVKRVAPKIKEKKNKKFKKPGYNKRNAKVATKDDLDKFKD